MNMSQGFGYGEKKEYRDLFYFIFLIQKKRRELIVFCTHNKGYTSLNYQMGFLVFNKLGMILYMRLDVPLYEKVKC